MSILKFIYKKYVFPIILFFICYIQAEVFQGYTLLFIISWIAQFIGHKIEGKKPAFVKDLKFLLIGPAWLLSFIYIKFKIKL